MRLTTYRSGNIINTTQKIQKLKIVATVSGIILFGAAIRAAQLFVHETIPGLNGAYYLVQARAIMRTATIGIPDLPLLFYVHAVISGLLSLFMPADRAIMLTVRLADSILPALVALPLYFIARELGRGKGRTSPILSSYIAAGIFAVGNFSLFRMIGDFQKNSAAMPFYLFFIYFLFRSLEARRVRDILMAVLFFSLTALTHIGVTALALTTTAFFAIIEIFTRGPIKRKITIVLALATATICVLGLLTLSDSSRADRMRGYLLKPITLFTGSKSVQPAPAGTADRPDFGNGPGGTDRPDGPDRARMRGNLGSGGMDPRMSLPGVILGLLLGVGGLTAVFRFRGEMSRAECSLFAACSLTALLFAFPLINGDLSERLRLMVFAPGAIILLMLGLLNRRMLAMTWFTAIIVTLMTLFGPTQTNPSKVNTAGLADLKTLAESLPEGRNIVIATHGLEWWTAWVMDCYVASHPEAAIEAWDDYDRVYVLDNTGSPGNFPTKGIPPGPGTPGVPPGIPFSPVGNGMPGMPPGAGLSGMRGGNPEQIMIPSSYLKTVAESGQYRLSLLTSKPDMRQEPDVPLF